MRMFLFLSLLALHATSRVNMKDSSEGLKMRVDDDLEGERLACVDCPSYVGLSASAKLKVLWDNILSDEYKTPYMTRCAGELGDCVCDGKVKFGAQNKWTKWVNVRSHVKCGTKQFGGKDPWPGHRKECWCQHQFPMKWVGLIERELGDQKARVKNDTLAMFFDRFSDENPKDTSKVIHTFGMTAKAKFVPAKNTGYTGMWKTGADHAVLRISAVADWTKACKGGIDFNFNGCLKPSMAFKMLRDGDYSSNTVAQVNLGDGVGWNFAFFNYTHATHLPTPSGFGSGTVKDIFSAAAPLADINGVALQELSSDGSRAHQSKSKIKAPTMAFFTPTNQVHGRFSNDLHDFRHDLQQITSGTKVYDVYSVDFADKRCTKDGVPVIWEDLKSSCPKKYLGYIQTTSRFVASYYEDTRLFFKHERLHKGGPWKRQKCASKRRLASSSEYRLPDDETSTCTHNCPSGTSKGAASGSCPFHELE